MTSLHTMRWGILAVIAALAVPSTLWAQRANDDADSYSESRNARSDAEPPRLMRGGIMQQLRSVTESVIGTPLGDKANDKSGDKSKDKPNAKGDRSSSKSETKSNVPTPPPLGAKRSGSEPRGRSYTPDDFSSDAVAPQQPDRNPGAGRAWAGQFLIPNYRLRDQVGTRGFRPPTNGRTTSNTADLPQVPATARAESKNNTNGPRVSGLPDQNGPSRRVYLGQTSPANQSPEDAGVEEVLVDTESSEPVPPRSRLRDEDKSQFHLADDDAPAEEEPAEVLVSHVPDVPFVPRKPLPKKPSVSSSGNNNSPASRSANTAANKPASVSPSAPTSSATQSNEPVKPEPSKPEPSKPELTKPNLPSVPSLQTLPNASLPSIPPATQLASPPATQPTTQPLIPSTPKPLPASPSTPASSSNSTPLPTLELSSKTQDQVGSPAAALPAVPSKPVPTPATKVPAKTVSAPAGNALPTPPTKPAPGTINKPAVDAKPSASVPGSLPTGSPTSVPALPSAPLPTPGPTNPSVAMPSLQPPKMPAPPSLNPPVPPSSPTLAPPSLVPPAASSSHSHTPTLTPPGSTPSSLPSVTPALPKAAPSATQLPAAAPPALPAAPTMLPQAQAPAQAPPAALSAPANQQRLHMEIPHVAVQLIGPGDLTAGTPTNYELHVQNSDRLALNGLVLRMETPSGVRVMATGPGAAGVEIEPADDGATLLNWTVSKLNAGGKTSLPLQLTSDSARNFAVAIEWTVLPQSGVDEIVVKQADLQVALEGPVEVEKHGSNAYQLRVSNPGSAPAKDVKVVVSTGSAGDNSVDVGDLNPGQTEVIELDLTFEKAGQVQIGAVAKAGSLSRSTSIQVNVRQPVVVAQLSVPEKVLHGQTMIAHVVVGNSGDAPARNLQVALQLPAGTETMPLPAGMTIAGDKLLWNVDQIPAGQEITVPVELRMSQPGTHELALSCVAPDGASASAKGQVTIEAFADLKLLVNDPVAPAPVGAPVTYELTITNRGSLDAKNVHIVAQFSDGIEPESAVGCNHQIVPGQVRFETIPQIAAGQSVQLKVTARASVAGVHRFRAEVRCDDNEARLVEEESTRYLDSPGRIASPPGTTINR